MRVRLSPEEQEELLELRMRGSQRARGHQVVQQRCPACGSWLAADLVAAIERGEQSCPTAARIRAVFREAMADLFGPIERAVRSEASGGASS